jgi:outer membrane protein insertion porin family
MRPVLLPAAIRAAGGAASVFFLLAGGSIQPLFAQESARAAAADSGISAAADSGVSATPEPAPPPVAERGLIAEVRAAGFANVDSIVVLRTFAVAAGEPYDRAHISEGVRRLYATGLFTDVSVTDRTDEGRLAITVTVRERPRIQGVTFQGVRKIEEKTLREKITVADGQLLDPSVLDLDARKITDAYAQEGYARAQAVADLDPVGPGTVSVRFEITEGEKQKVRQIVIHGAQYLSSEKLIKAMKSERPGFLKSGTYKPAHLEEDMSALRLYMRSRGYRDADVDSIRPANLPDGKGVALHVHLREGPRYRFGTMTWSGATTVPVAALEFVTSCVDGMPYNESQVQKTLQDAYELYQETGYLFLSIDPQFADRDTIVDINFVVQEGARSRVADLRIVGNTRTKENVIRREAKVRPGDVFRRSSLIRTQRDIFGLGYFQDVQVDYEPTGDSADINLTLKVQEKQTGTASAGAGYSSQTGLTGFLELGHNNLFGNGQSIAIRLERGGRRRDLQLSFTEPWYRDTPLSIGFDVFNTQRELDFYDRKDVGGGIRFGRPMPWPDYTRGVIGYDLRDVSLSNFDDFRLGEPLNLQQLRGTSWPRRVSSLSLSFTRNSTDNPFHPSRGSKLTWVNTVAGGPLGGVEEYLKESFELRNYTRLHKPFTLMLRTKAGFLTGATVPDYERFRLGGTTSDYLRGYPDYYVVPRDNITHSGTTGNVIERYPGGRTMLIMTTELQFPIADPLHALLFFDLGNTWNSTRDLDLGDLRKGAGFGFRMEVPALGRVGFDVGYGLDREEGGSWQTHFQLGNTF